MTTVTIRNLHTGTEYTSTHRTRDEHEALGRALRRHWGKRALWHADSGLGFHYGQVIVPAGYGSYNCVTPRCRVDFN